MIFLLSRFSLKIKNNRPKLSLGTGLLMLILPLVSLRAQHLSDPFKVIGKSEGLPSLLNNKVYETSDGYLWLATQNGLARFDGRQFKMFYSFYADSNTITGNVITDLEEDSYHQLWISNFSKGISVYNLQKGTWQQFPHPTPDANPTYRVLDIFRDKNDNMWIGTMGRGLLKYDYGKRKFIQYLLNKDLTSDGNDPDDNTVRKITDDPYDSAILWLACMDGLYRFNKNTGQLTRFENIKNGKKDWKDNCFHAMLAPPGNMIWLGTWGGGVITFNKETRSFINYPYDNKGYSRNDVDVNIVFDLYAVSDTSLYVATLDNGLLEWNTVSHKFYPVIAPQGGPTSEKNASIRGISATSNNCLWVCGINNIYLFNKVYNRFGNWQPLYKKPGPNYTQLNDALWLPATNRYWLAARSWEGILEYDSNFHFLRIVSVQGREFKEAEYRCIKKDGNGAIWMQTTSAPYFYQYDSTTDRFKKVNDFLPAADSKEPLSRFVIDKKNRIWTVTDSFLLSYNTVTREKAQFSLVPDPESRLQLPLTVARIIIDDNDRIWIATNIGVWSFDTRTRSWEHIFPGKKNGMASLADADIGAIASDRNGKLWVAPSSQGIQVYDPVQEKIEKSFHVSTDPSFHSSAVTYMQPAPDGNMWICTYNGLAVWERDKDQWEWFYQRDGIVKDYADQPIIITQNGKALLAQYDGFTAFDTRHWIRNEFIPRLKIEGIYVDGNPVLAGESDSGSKIEMGSNQKRVSFSFSAIEPLFPDRVQYWYKLDAYDNNWHIAGPGQVEYNGLLPGNYTFHVKAKNSDGLWSKELIIPVTVLAPLWKKWWFVPLGCLSLLLMAYLLYRYRLSQILKMQEMRNRISRNLHDEIGSSVSSVNMLSAVAKRQLEEGHPVRNMLNQIGESAQQAGESIDEIVWSINPGYDVAATTFNRIRNHVSDLFESTGIDYTIELPEVSPAIKLNTELRQDIWLICKEAVNNIIKYSECSYASLSIKWENKLLRIDIQDNGKGFDVDKAIHKNRSGLKNMRARVEKYRRGIFKIESEPGTGTRVYCCIPAKNNPKM
ncbi:MAG: two-component regulator propeller domain-containing protein [Bacteroidota bacterium]|nr:two-component regulator propeller domain-containing protein [Bacteroidota bacterium]